VPQARSARAAKIAKDVFIPNSYGSAGPTVLGFSLLSSQF
jgi:hypothetical protein